MKLRDIIIIIAISAFTSLCVVGLVSHANKLIGFDEMSDWFCVEKQHSEWSRLYDQELYFGELVKKFPKDKKLHLRYHDTLKNLRHAEKEWDNPNTCVKSNYFWYYPQNIRKIDNSHGKGI